jgi:hypothetical protein
MFLPNIAPHSTTLMNDNEFVDLFETVGAIANAFIDEDIPSDKWAPFAVSLLPYSIALLLKGNSAQNATMPLSLSNPISLRITRNTTRSKSRRDSLQLSPPFAARLRGVASPLDPWRCSRSILLVGEGSKDATRV